MDSTSLKDSGLKSEADGKWDMFVGKVRESYGEASGDKMAEFNGNMQQAKGWLVEQYGDAKTKLGEYFEDNE